MLGAGRFRWRRRAGAVALVGTLALLVVGGTAGATAAGETPLRGAPWDVTLPASAFLRAGTRASDGYRLTLFGSRVEASAQGGEPAQTSSEVGLRLSRIGSAAFYSSRETSFGAGGAVAADWGASGSVRARFVSRHRHYLPIRWCEGRYTVESGFLVGSLRFRGERGYASAAATRLPATVTRTPEARCHFPAPTRSDDDHGSANVGGYAGRRGRQIYFSAEEHPALGTLGLRASVSEVHGGMAVTRSAYAVAPFSALSVDREAESATVTAAPPFTGSATFEAFPGKESGTWRGDLTVDFPGEPRVRLAGKRFHGEKLKPGECSPDERGSCSSVRFGPGIGLHPNLPLRETSPVRPRIGD